MVDREKRHVWGSAGSNGKATECLKCGALLSPITVGEECKGYSSLDRGVSILMWAAIFLVLILAFCATGCSGSPIGPSAIDDKSQGTGSVGQSNCKTVVTPAKPARYEWEWTLDGYQLVFKPAEPEKRETVCQ